MWLWTIRPSVAEVEIYPSICRGQLRSGRHGSVAGTTGHDCANVTVAGLAVVDIREDRVAAVGGAPRDSERQIVGALRRPGYDRIHGPKRRTNGSFLSEDVSPIGRRGQASRRCPGRPHRKQNNERFSNGYHRACSPMCPASLAW